jgi:broad specificity phosphatase PhoE
MMSYIFILRHGPIYWDKRGVEQLDVTKLKCILPDIFKYIFKYCDNIDEIYTSPVSRCELTGSIIAVKFECSVNIEQELLRRPNNSPESRCHAYERGYDFGEKIFKNNKHKNILIVTHSSMYQSVVEGVVGRRVSKKFGIHVNDTALTIYNSKKDRLCDFNVEMYSSNYA